MRFYMSVGFGVMVSIGTSLARRRPEYRNAELAVYYTGTALSLMA
jgi:predicted MFS family arabinose efflux permease